MVDELGNLTARFESDAHLERILLKIPHTEKEVATSNELSHEHAVREDSEVLDEPLTEEAAAVGQATDEPTSIQEALDREMQAIMDGRTASDGSKETWESLRLNDPLVKFMVSSTTSPQLPSIFPLTKLRPDPQTPPAVNRKTHPRLHRLLGHDARRHPLSIEDKGAT